VLATASIVAVNPVFITAAAIPMIGSALYTVVGLAKEVNVFADDK
jgi:hypothetical protein